MYRYIVTHLIYQVGIILALSSLSGPKIHMSCTSIRGRRERIARRAAEEQKKRNLGTATAVHVVILTVYVHGLRAYVRAGDQQDFL